MGIAGDKPCHMAMKKTSGGDSPLWQSAKKSFWTLPIFGSTTTADRDVF
jgi:hypothetical protein